MSADPPQHLNFKVDNFSPSARFMRLVCYCGDGPHQLPTGAVCRMWPLVPSRGRGGRGRRAAPDLSRYGPNVRVPALHATPEAVAVEWDAALGDRCVPFSVVVAPSSPLAFFVSLRSSRLAATRQTGHRIGTRPKDGLGLRWGGGGQGVGLPNRPLPQLSWKELAPDSACLKNSIITVWWWSYRSSGV